MRRLALTLALLAGCSSSAKGTFVLVTFEAGAPLADLRQIDLVAELGGKSATIHITRPGNAVMVLPLTKSLEIGSGAGTLTLTATALDGAQQMLGMRTAMVDVVRDHTSQVTVHFGDQLGDGGVDASDDGGGDGGGQMLVTADVSSYDFGSVQVSQTVSHNFIITNLGTVATGPLAPDLTGAGASAFAADGAACAAGIMPGRTCVLGVSFTPTAAAPAVANLEIGGATVTLTGTGIAMGNLAITPSVPFSSVIVGQTATPMSFTVQNQGATMTGRLGAMLTGTDRAQYTIMSDQCSTLVLAPAATCMISVVFAPTSPGDKTASLAVTAAPGGTAVASLTGRATNAFTITPGNQDFGALLLGTPSATTTFTVMNTTAGATTAPLMVALSGADASQFSIIAAATGDCMNGVTTLSAGQSCTVKARFTPTAGGVKAAVLVVSASIGGSVSANLAGTGLRPALLEALPTSHDFGTALTGSSSPSFPIVVMNTGDMATGALTITVGGTNAGDYMLVAAGGCVAGSPLAAGASCNVNVVFHPTAKGARTATVTIAGTPGGMQAVALMGAAQNPALLTSSPPSANFGTVRPGQMSAPTTLTITNTGDLATGAIVATVTGNTAEFPISMNTCMGATLAPAGTCTIVLTLAPTTAGAKMLSISLAATPGGPLAIAITGDAQSSPASFALAPPTLTFPATLLSATSTSMAVTVTNTGQVPSGTMSFGFSGAASTDFVIQTTPGDCMTGATLANGASCTLHAAFRPTARGSRMATLVVSGAPASPTVTLTGTGQAPATLSGSPGMLAFPATPVNQTSTPIAFTVTNTGDLPTTTVSATLGGASPSQFLITSNTCTAVLAAGQTCTVNVAFRPGLASSFGATLMVSATTGGVASATLTGTGEPTVNVSAVGTGTGSVTGFVVCIGPCVRMMSVPGGTAVNLTASPMPGTYFSGWSGDCHGTNPSCSAIANADLNIVAHFEAANIAFVTNQMFTGMNFTPTPDQTCQQAANSLPAGAPPNTYMAFMTFNAVPPQARFPSAARGWISPSGKPLGDTLANMLGSGPINPLFETETMSQVSGSQAWTGLRMGGAPDNGNDCNNWMSGGGQADVGQVGGGGSTWYSTTLDICFVQNRIYCFGTQKSQPLVLLP